MPMSKTTEIFVAPLRQRIKRLVIGGIFCTMNVMGKRLSKRDRIWSIVRHGVVAALFVVIATPFSTVWAASYTDKQLEALATRVGQIYWIAAVDNRTPMFLSAPAPNASSFRAPANASFEITELTGWKAKNPYYKVRFESGKEGYIRPEAFHEEFNLTILTVDPQADMKKKAAQAEEANKQRVAWIEAQPWSQAVKEAAINRQAVLGMNVEEVRKVLGSPARVFKGRGGQGAKVKTQSGVIEERWLYAGGTELVFRNGLLVRIESKEKKEP